MCVMCAELIHVCICNYVYMDTYIYVYTCGFVTYAYTYIYICLARLVIAEMNNQIGGEKGGPLIKQYPIA